MKSIVIVAYLTSSMATPAMAIMLYQTTSVVVIKFWISRILIRIVFNLLIMVVVVMPLMPIVFSCHEVIKMPQQSSKASVDTSNGWLHWPKLGVGGKLCGLQHTNLLICHLYISIKALCVFLHIMYQSLNNTFVRGDCGGVCSSSSAGPAMVRFTETKNKTSEEEQKA
jgi:hypothetical protein